MGCDDVFGGFGYGFTRPDATTLNFCGEGQVVSCGKIFGFEGLRGGFSDF